MRSAGNQQNEAMTLRLSLPSKGSMYDQTLTFFESCGLKVSRPNPRRYTAGIRSLPETEVLLNRPPDVVEKTADGEFDIGVSGLDLVEELRGDRDDLLVLYEDLGYSRCELIVAVPDTWIDVTSWRDLADLSVEMQARGRLLTIATKYPALSRQFCYAQGINFFQLIDSQGATEAAPGRGYADLIIDITETGTTIRDNQLKIVGGPILRSQACLIGNRANLAASPERREAVKTILERIEARRRAGNYMQVVANVPGTSVEDVGQRVAARPELAGLQGPTVSPVHTLAGSGPNLYSVTIVVPQERMLAVVDHLRSLGGGGMAVLSTQYVFDGASHAYEQMLAALK